MTETGTNIVNVTDVRVLSRYVVELTFDTGEVKVIDLEPGLWGECYNEIRADYELFRQVHVDAVTIVWPNGEDWSPDDLYERSKAAVPAAATAPAS